MSEQEKATPVTPDESEDIRVSLELDDGGVECRSVRICEAGEED